MKQGAIYLVRFPFTDGSGSKVRPVLVVSPDVFNRGEDLVVVSISSQAGDADPLSVFILADDRHFKATGLKVSSAVKWTKPLTVSKRVLLRRLGRLDRPILSEVLGRLERFFALAK